MKQPTQLESKCLGSLGEKEAERYLIQKGYRIVERNFRCKIGEIDIVAYESEFLVFVEVKTRGVASESVSPLISLTKAKCARLRKLGEYYLVKHKIFDRQPRFDVIGIRWGKSKNPTIEHIENAF